MGFVREAWHVLEPAAPFIDGWHLHVICDHLEAITWGRINPRLCINVPPGAMKSLLVSVFWAAWEWGPCGMPQMRYIATSYKEDYVKRDSRRMRDLVRSEWYQNRWGDLVTLTRVGESSFANSATGWREGIPFASLTGGRGDRVIIDDPHSTETAESDAERTTTTRIFRESVPTRVNDPAKSAIVVVMQRLHEEDVSGVIEELGLGYERLILPMEFDPERRCETSLGVVDHRQAAGELLWPERFPREVVDRDKIPLGAYAIAGQFQQLPAPRHGGLFEREWLENNIIAAADVPQGRTVRYWDFAATEPKRGNATPDNTSGTKARYVNGVLYIMDNASVKQAPAGVEATVKQTASDDGRICEIGIEEEPGSSGKMVTHHYQTKVLQGFTVWPDRPTGPKVERARPWAALASRGNVKLVKGPWNRAFIDECASFPRGKRDRVDSTSGAFKLLSQGGALRSGKLKGFG